ncbi:hypothetical protein BSKO_12663 [Bryopsis sp. KO-2023]|nr:hypothetical protein BSKO_12663 [Bryopsis sp. KO-2023]
MLHTHQSMRELKPPTTGELHRHVCELAEDEHAQVLAFSRNLDIVMASPVECAQFKGSVWGPCVSDMTLVVKDENDQPVQMSIIRHPYYFDATWSVPMEKIPLVVGNQKQSLHKTPLQSVDLGTFLDNISVYTDLNCSSLKAPGDSDAVVSAQTCVLPVQEGRKVNFHVELYNYHQDPPVLVIVTTSKGTSVQVLDKQNTAGGFHVGAHGQKLRFNNAGQRCTFASMGVKDDRAETGVPLTGTMEASEKGSDVIVVVQVPLIRKQRAGSLFFPGGAASFLGALNNIPNLGFGGGGFGGGGFGGRRVFGSSPPTPVEGLGQTQCPFPALKDYLIARDDMYPVRVTIQWCKGTVNGEVDAEVIDSIANQMEEAESRSDWWESLMAGKFQSQHQTALRYPVESFYSNPDGHCDKCGIRYRRLACPDFNFCEVCEVVNLRGHHC